MSILEKLYDNTVVDFELLNNNTKVVIWEACDNYFNMEFNKEEFGQFIDELKELHKQMNED